MACSMLHTRDIPASIPAILSPCQSQPQRIPSLSSWPWVTIIRHLKTCPRCRHRLSITSFSSKHSMFLTSSRYGENHLITLNMTLLSSLSGPSSESTNCSPRTLQTSYGLKSNGQQSIRRRGWATATNQRTGRCHEDEHAETDGRGHSGGDEV